MQLRAGVETWCLSKSCSHNGASAKRVRLSALGYLGGRIDKRRVTYWFVLAIEVPCGAVRLIHLTRVRAPLDLL